MLAIGRRWAEAGHRVQVITRPIAGKPPTESIDGVQVRRSIRTTNLGPMFGLTFLHSLHQSLKRYACADDVVLAAQGLWESVATGRFSRIAQRPITLARIATTAGCGELSLLRGAKGSALWRKWFLQNRGFLALSAEAYDELVEFGAVQSSIHRVTNGVDYLRFFGKVGTDRPRVVLFVGRLAPQKNPRMLIDAWLLACQSDWRLRIVGDGPMRDELMRLVDARSLSNVEFVGTSQQMPEIYRDASVFLLPSVGEGCCNALLESMAAGLCPIVSDIGGNREIIAHNCNGLLVPPHDANQVSERLKLVMNSTELRTTLARNAQAAVQSKHDLDRVAQQYLDLFEHLRCD